MSVSNTRPDAQARRAANGRLDARYSHGTRATSRAKEDYSELARRCSVDGRDGGEGSKMRVRAGIHRSGALGLHVECPLCCSFMVSSSYEEGCIGLGFVEGCARFLYSPTKSTTLVSIAITTSTA